ncbi:hypothetical protein BU15DRAFT_89661 [Melanogaster broomeanus]|nr:hypothetical protein BU15DRAFT_89661 [Melanogaster broomeanus]
MPSDKVSTLASLISNQKSVFYTGQDGPIPSSLAACVDPSLALESISASSSGSSSSGSNVRQDAIIGVVSSLGAIALIIIAYVVYRVMKRRREVAHRRLSDPVDGYAGVRPEGQDFDRDSVGGHRRRSFYYAEDSLMGYQGVRAEEDGMRERRAVPVRTGAISTPILRESTMNW